MTHLIVALMVALAGLPVGLLWARKARRDQQYSAVAPGTMDDGGPIARADEQAPLAVRFTPPQTTAGLVNYLGSKKVESKDMVALIMTWAVKGAVVLDVRQPDGADSDSTEREYWLRPTGNRSKLEGIENDVFEVVLGDSDEPVLFGKDNQSLKQRMAVGQQMLQEYADAQPWFDPALGRAPRLLAGGVGAAALVLWLLNFHVVALGFVAFAVIMSLLANPSKKGGSTANVPRTATGRALWDQSRGFELYLTTAEADQIKWEEANDIFSRYLPYAIAYGCADRWVKTFKDLADARGMELDTPQWYVASFAGNVADALMFSMVMNSLDLDLGSLVELGDWSDFAGAGDALGEIGSSIGDAVSGFDVGDLFGD